MRLDRVKTMAHMRKVGIAELGDLADAVGVLPQSISGWFRGAQHPTWARLETLCELLEATPDQLLIIEHRVTPLPRDE